MREVNDKIASEPVASIGMTEIDPEVSNAMGEAWAKTMDGGEGDWWPFFRDGRLGGVKDPDVDKMYVNIYQECMENAQAFLRHLHALGFDVVKMEKHDA